MTTLLAQRQILEANGDAKKLAAIAERWHIDPNLWRFYVDAMAEVAKIERSANQHRDAEET